MAGFDPAAPPSAVQACPDKAHDPNGCCSGKAADDKLIRSVRQRRQSLLSKPRTGMNACQDVADGIGKDADTMEQYSKALPAAKASLDMNHLGDQAFAPVNQPCLRRMPLGAKELNKELGIPPDSPGAITDEQLRNDKTGFRAALYKSESDGRYILVSRDTEAHSLADWQTNVSNGLGKDTKQYEEMRDLTGQLVQNNIPFDISGYSKGGGLAQEGGLVSSNSQVYVFNSAGLNDASLRRTNQTSFGSLKSRTSSFSAQGDFLTYMNTTTDPNLQIRNGEFLRRQLGGWTPIGAANPIAVTYSNPATQGRSDPGFAEGRAALLKQLDGLIADRRANPNGPSMFPPVRSGTQTTIPNSMSTLGGNLGGWNNEANFGKLVQHKMDNVVVPMQNEIDRERDVLRRFLVRCG